jgi:ferredoxin
MVSTRQRDDGQGVFGILRGDRRRYSVWFDERRRDGRFPIVEKQHLTTAGAADTRAYEYDRGYSQSGPIPAQCRSGSCGTCWVGVLGGAEKLSEVDRLEARRLKECGYFDDPAGTPFIRLACMARAAGNVTIVIPPWNGFIGTSQP